MAAGAVIVKRIKPPIVTVGLPFLNSHHTLADAIRSVFAQRLHEWELILVDDGSSDGSVALAKAIQDPRVRVYSDGVNRQLSARLNQIADLARGRYVARMDADDLMHSERLCRQVEFLEAHPEIDLVSSAMFTTDGTLRVVGIRGHDTRAVNMRNAVEGGLFCHPTVVARTAWARANRYDPAYPRAEDFELWCRVASNLRAAQLTEPMYFYREPRRTNLAAYLQSSRTKRRILQRYGPAAVGIARTTWLQLSTHVKDLLYCATHLGGLDYLLVQRRNYSLDTATLAKATEELRRLRITSVPGLELPSPVPDGVPLGEVRPGQREVDPHFSSKEGPSHLKRV
jgi:glycosyltransferase involved in cell wall biosynthesis